MDKVTITSNPQALEVNWSRRYVMTKSGMQAAPGRRHCWMCHQAFEVGDDMTVVNTPEGNKLVYSRCFNC